MAVDILRVSRLQFSTLRSQDGYEFWERGEPVEIPADVNDQTYEVQESDRLDLIAYRFYNNPNLGWVIAAANNIRLPSLELIKGRTIRIPSGSYVFGTLLTR